MTTGTADPYVVRAQPRDVDVLTQLIFKAFFAIAPCTWLFEKEEVRRDRLPDLLRVHVEYALTHGLVYTTEDRAAVALWHIHRGGPHQDDPGYAAGIAAAIGPEYEDRASMYARRTLAARPTEPHDYLHIAAVDPARQRQGTGLRLLTGCHRDLAQTGRPAYLEASDKGTRTVYGRLNYADAKGPGILLPDPETRLYPMRRPWIPARDQAVSVREHVPDWGGEHGRVISVKPLICEQPVTVEIDGDEARGFNLTELEPSCPREPRPQSSGHIACDPPALSGR